MNKVNQIKRMSLITSHWKRASKAISMLRKEALVKKTTLRKKKVKGRSRSFKEGLKYNIFLDVDEFMPTVCFS